MSQMCPSSSHQLVAAAIAFRRARRKFPKNFGQLSRSVNHERKDNNKIEPVFSMKPCEKCEQRFARQQAIRCVRSNDVWPRCGVSSSEHPRGTKSAREKDNPLDRTKEETRTKATSCGGCACRSICRSAKRNYVVSFREDERWDNRSSAGDGATRSNFGESISCKSCEIREKSSDCCSIGKQRSRGKKHDGKSKPKKRSSELERYSVKNDNLDLLYDRSCIRTNNSVSFSAKEHDDDSSLEDESGCFDCPSKLRDWKNRAREDAIETATGPGGMITNDEATEKCDCAIKLGKSRSQSHSIRRHRQSQHSHRIRCERERLQNSRYEDETVNPEASRPSSSKQSSRLCKDCAFGQCPKNCSPVASVHEDREPEDDEDRGVTVNDACAIKHKDSMALIVEKFNNRKTTAISSDDEEIFQSDDDRSDKTKINDKTIPKRTCDERHRNDREKFPDEDFTRCNIYKNAGLSESCKFHSRGSSKNKKFLNTPHRRCCCSLENVL